MKLPISVFIVALNEEKNICRLLESLKSFDEIIMVDSGSADKTIEIAESYSVRIFHQTWLGYAKQKQYAMSLCTHDWVLNLDADEELTPELIIEIGARIQQDDIHSLRFTRNDIFIDKMQPKHMRKPSNLRLYRKSFANFDEKQLVHESAEVQGKEVLTKKIFNHYGYNDIHTLIEKNNIYSSLNADEKYSRGKSSSTLKLICIFPFEFLRKFLFQRYFMFGRRGFILAIINANYAFIKEAKLLEHQLKN